MPFGWEIYTAFWILTILILYVGVLQPAYMSKRWYQGVCVIAFGYQAWHALDYVQTLNQVSDAMKSMFFVYGIINAFVGLLKVIRLFMKEKKYN